MIKHWAKLSCLFACTQFVATACIVVDDGQESTDSTVSTGSGGTAGTGGSGAGGSTGASGGSGGGDTTGNSASASTTSSSTTASDGGSGGSGGGTGTTGDAGAGGAGEPVHTSDLVGLEDGEFHEGAPPASSGYDGEQISDINGPDSVTNGGTFTIKVTIPNATGQGSFVVGVKGDSGHFTTTATANAEGVFEIAITLNSDVDQDTLTVEVAPVDAEGDVGNYAEVDFDVITSGTGDVKITLSFDESTDLDLRVVEPNGTEIYYGARVSASGGELDLDSNPQCNPIDGTNIENIFWPPGSAPVGEYHVAVDYFQACVEVPVNYTVTITIGEDVKTFTGSFEAAVAGTEDRRREVATILVD